MVTMEVPGPQVALVPSQVWRSWDVGLCSGCGRSERL